MLTESPDIFLRDLGVPVIWGSVSGLGLFQSPDQVIGQFSMSTEYEVIVKTSLFSAIDDGESITVNNVSYEVRGAPQKIDDGVFMKITLTKT